MAIKPRSAKSKGRRLQKWVCEKLSSLSGIPWGPEDEMEIQSRPMAQKGVDVVLRGQAAELFPFSFECKNGESFSIVQSIEQARMNEAPGRPWIIVHKRQKFRNPVVMMDWTTFENMLRDRLDLPADSAIQSTQEER